MATAKPSSPVGPFAGFPADFFAFFEELAANNSRAWFADNKQRYQTEVVDAMVRFIVAMGPLLRKVSPHFVADPRPNGGSMFRIHRDVRFSKDKRPYKEHAACHFRHAAARDAHAPGFYVHLAPDEIMFGGGIWIPPGDALDDIRAAIDRDRAGWTRVVTDKRLVETFGGVTGEGLKRPPRGYNEGHPHIDDLKRKTFFVIRESGPKAARSPDFVGEVAAAFRDATPLMRFIAGALGQPF
ncbi:MAG TPA: DUF2461 domain-containing protein [Alphaproteobacteria bacterium]